MRTVRNRKPKATDRAERWIRARRGKYLVEQCNLNQGDYYSLHLRVTGGPGQVWGKECAMCSTTAAPDGRGACKKAARAFLRLCPPTHALKAGRRRRGGAQATVPQGCSTPNECYWGAFESLDAAVMRIPRNNIPKCHVITAIPKTLCTQYQ